MHRAWCTRLVAAVLAVWLALVVGEAGLVHVCPMHDGVAPAHAAGAAHHQGHAGHQGHQGAPAHEHQHCSCIGCCTVGNALVPPLRVQITPVAVALVAPVRVTPEASLLPRPGPRYARPLTTGPPRA